MKMNSRTQTPLCSGSRGEIPAEASGKRISGKIHYQHPPRHCHWGSSKSLVRFATEAGPKHTIKKSRRRHATATMLNIAMFVAMLMLPGVKSLRAQSTDFDAAPIRYSDTVATDPVAKLAGRIEAGQASLSWDVKFGWLPSLLKHLKIPPSSQLLVFSKTSLQTRKISPSQPRAVYFNDNVYLATVANGGNIEICAADPNLGAVFYTLDSEQSTATGDAPLIARNNTACLTCHGNSRTQDVPGFLVRSVFPSPSGQPRFELGTTTTNIRSDFVERFGGWYITGTHGQMRHRGNAVFPEENRRSEDDEGFDLQAGANQTKLPPRVRPGSYLRDSSDIVAMMVLEHQTQMHNAITRASFAWRQTMSYQAVLNEAIGRNPDYISPSTKSRIDKACDNLVSHLLMVDEFSLTSPVKGTSTFAEDFQNAAEFGDAPNQSQGRLRQLDLTTRLFRYPCSFLIYSESFDAIPPAMLEKIYRRVEAALSGTLTDGFEHLTPSDREQIRKILIETKPAFAALVKQSLPADANQ